MAEQRKIPTGRPRFITAVAACSLGLLLLAASLGERQPSGAHGNGLFSWNEAALEESMRGALFDAMKGLELTELYQSVPRGAHGQTVRAFTSAAAGEGIAVYLLTGDPAWGLDGTGASMAAEIDRAAGYGGLRGVVMDVEPYLTREWQADPQGVMEAYVEGMTRAREAADAAGLELVACVPYFYDSLGHAGALEALVEGGCHALAVMNYDKRDEAGNLEAEAALAAARGLPLIMIYELQPPGSHDLTEGNTYYNDGLGPLLESWDRLRRRYGRSMSYALHEYESLREVLER